MKSMLKDEAEAPKDYSKINSAVYGSLDKEKGLRAKNIIDGIIADEKRHFKLDSELYNEVCK